MRLLRLRDAGCFSEMLLIATAALLSAFAPSFDSFTGRSLGSWRGASYSWNPKEADGSMPLGVAPGSITPPVPSSTVVEEVMRSCGGAVQGVRELRQPDGGEVPLNRQVDGTTFFSCGSWALAPAVLSGGGDEEDMLSSPEAFGLQICLGHADETRRRMLIVLLDGELACCDVAIEGRAGDDADADGDASIAPAAALLLQRRLQVVVEAKAWEGGATSLDLTGSPSAGGDAPWVNARLSWAEVRGEVEGGSDLVPADAAYLPGGAWVRIDKSGGAGGLSVEAGSVAADAAEVKAITHDFDARGSLARVSLRSVEARE